MDYIEGYKAYNKDFTDKYGNKHFAGEKLHIEGEVKVGPFNGNGFHLCKKFEDTFRYVPDECILCEVIGFGKISNEYIDYYYDYDGIYACSDLYIKRVVPREEIVEMAKQLPDYRLERLIQTYSMTDEEI
ncbi:MAG: hypothetical protein IJ093_00815, partial [Bacilli bacterium]|nr:hypothetical protein [Bacilli bacterium]